MQLINKQINKELLPAMSGCFLLTQETICTSATHTSLLLPAMSGCFLLTLMIAFTGEDLEGVIARYVGLFSFNVNKMKDTVKITCVIARYVGLFSFNPVFYRAYFKRVYERFCGLNLFLYSNITLLYDYAS